MYGCGWFDGGCFIFARAIQLWLGGSLAVLLRPEFLKLQAFDHVVVRLEHCSDFSEALYMDADGLATKDELVSRWRTRERLLNVQLEDPADPIRFVGHLENRSMSAWVAQQLHIRFGNPEKSWIELQRNCNRVRI